MSPWIATFDIVRIVAQTEKITEGQYQKWHVPSERALARAEESDHPSRMEQSPRHRSDLVEETESGMGSGFVDGSCLGKKPKMAVDLFC